MSAKSQNTTQLIQDSKPLPSEPKTDQQPPVKRAAPKAEVDYKVLNRLMENKETFKKSKQVNRVGFSFLLGVVFHYFYVAANCHFCTLGSFIPIIIVFYYLMEQYEKINYSNPISVRNS